MKLLFCVLISALGLLAQDKPAPPKLTPKVTAISAEHMDRMNFLILQQQNLRLEVCSDAGIHYKRCNVQWQQGIVNEILPPEVQSPEAPKPQPPKAETKKP